MTRTILLMLLTAILSIALTYTLMDRVTDRRLAQAKEEIQVAWYAADSLGAALQVAVAFDDTMLVARDSLEEALTRSEVRRLQSRRAIPVVAAQAPDTCLPWLNRSVALQAALTDAESVIDTLHQISALDSLRIDSLRSAVTHAADRATSLAGDLERIHTLIPTTRAATRLLLLADVQSQANRELEATLALGTRLLGTDLYGGVTRELGSGTQRMTLGVRAAFRLH